MSDAQPPVEPSVKKPRFREPDTMTREQWDAMRNSLPERIDEVMASFREDKLCVKPRSPAPHDDEESQSTLFLLSDIPDPVRKKRWPWLVATAGLAGIIGAGWYVNNERAAIAKATNQAPSTTSTTSGKISEPAPPSSDIPNSRQATDTQPAINQIPVVKPATPETSPAAATQPPEEIPASPKAGTAAMQAATAPATALKASTTPATKPKSAKVKTGTKSTGKTAPAADEEVRTIEDLTPLLRGKDSKQP